MGSYLPGQIGSGILVIDSDINMGGHDILVDDVLESTNGHGVEVDGVDLKDNKLLQANVLMSQNKAKVASENLRHSIDAAKTVTSATYVQVTDKTLTFTNGIKGVIRVKATIDPALDKTGYYKLLKNGIGDPLAAEQSVVTNPLTGSDDITVDWDPGTTLNLFAKQTPDGNLNVTNFRVYYDDGAEFSAIPVAVTGAD